MLFFKSKGKLGKGVSLAELLIALGMLSGLLLITFTAFRMSTQVFSEGTVRQSAEQQLRVIRLLLERDVDLTSFWYASVVARTQTADNANRDALSLVGLSDWNASSLLPMANNQRPAWNRYVVWYATEEEKGRLVRQVVEPDSSLKPPDYLKAPYADLDNNIKDNPDSNNNVTSTRYLSEGVVDFKASQRLENGTITINLKLLNHGQARGVSLDKVQNHLEAKWVFLPKNSWPRL